MEKPFAAIGKDTDEEKAEIPRDICKGNLNKPEKGDPFVDGIPNSHDKSGGGKGEGESKYLHMAGKPPYFTFNAGPRGTDQTPYSLDQCEDQKMLDEP